MCDRTVVLLRANAGTLTFLAILGLTAGVFVGCQVAPTVSVKQLVEHRELADLSGLKPAQSLEDLCVSWAIPGQWGLLPVPKSQLFTHQQWRSPTLATAVGVAHVKMPLALPASAVIWLAKNEYLKRAKDDKTGKIIGQWTDTLGRQWFEAENSKYHVRGYVMSRGSDAWIVYSGWRVNLVRQPQEITMAERSAESVVPMN
jgi:hypothetical protein